MADEAARHRARLGRAGAEAYPGQLLETVWAYSTRRPPRRALRNFVDLPNLPDQGQEEHLRPRIRVIDMDGSVFRRLTGGDAQDRLWLWLYNVLVVSCFLKVAFEDHEFRRVWWDKIGRPSTTSQWRDAPRAGHLRHAGALGHRGVPRALRRLRLCGRAAVEQRFHRGGRARGAACIAHYLLYEPLQELRERYVDVVLNEARVHRTQRSVEASKAAKCFARRRGARRCAGALFERVAPRAAPRLVDVMVEFVDTRQEQLVIAHLMPQSQAHTGGSPSVPRDVLAAAAQARWRSDRSPCVNAAPPPCTWQVRHQVLIMSLG